MAPNSTLVATKKARYCAYLNGKYHSDREAWYDLWDKVTNFGMLATGSVAFSDLFGGNAQKIGAGFLVLFALAQLVVGFSRRAREHFQFKREYFAIASKLEAGLLKPADAYADMTRIACDEPPPYMALHAIAENWANQAVYGGNKTQPCHVGWFARLTRNLIRYSEGDFVYRPPSKKRETLMMYLFGCR